MDDLSELILFSSLLVVLLTISGILSGSETALFSIRSYRKNISQKVKEMIDSSRMMLVSILVGNTFVNIAIATIGAIFVVKFSKSENYSIILLTEILVVSGVILIFGEIIPKSIAFRRPESFISLCYRPLRFFTLIVYPISAIINKFTDVMIRDRSETLFETSEELKILTEISEEEGVLESDESDIIQSIIDFKEKMVREIMTPRVNMVSISSTSSIDDLMDLINSRRFSKIPIYSENIDNIVGIVYAKDILPYLIGSRPKIDLVSLSREVFFVPEAKKVQELLNDFKIKKTNIAIVVDEWGGTSGLITLEDSVEEITGEIQDSYDDEPILVHRQKDGTFVVDGQVGVYDLEEFTGIEFDFPDDRDYDTLAGLLLDHIGDIPKIGEHIVYGGRKFTVRHIDGNRIDRIHISDILKEVNQDD